MADRYETEPRDVVAYALRRDVEGERVAALVRTLLDVLPVDVHVTPAGIGGVGVDDLRASAAVSIGDVLQVGQAVVRLVQGDLWVDVAEAAVVVPAADEEVARVEVDERVQQHGAVVVTERAALPQQLLLLASQRRWTRPPGPRDAQRRVQLGLDQATDRGERLRAELVHLPHRHVRLDAPQEQAESTRLIRASVWLTNLDDEPRQQ